MAETRIANLYNSGITGRLITGEDTNPLDIMGVSADITENGYLTDRRKNPSAAATLSLLSQIHHSGAMPSLAEIIADRHGGIYPTRTQEEVEQLVQSGLILEETETGLPRYKTSEFGAMELSMNEIQDPKVVDKIIDEALQSLIDNPPDLPAEKYGNEEFRFTYESIAQLFKKMLADNAYARINIAVIGSPLIGVFATRCPDIVNAVSVFDINEDIIRYVNENSPTNQIRGALYDARMPFPNTLKGRYDSMVFDPPWHNEHYCLFADRAYEALRPLGKAYISTFAPATRPEANRELGELYGRFMDGGFNLSEITPQYFGYQIPEFERRVFNSQGIQVTSRGNYGQLVVLEKQPDRTGTSLTPALAEKLVEEVHIELGADKGVGSTTLWISREDAGTIRTTPLEISAVGDGQIYTTTSRSQRRKEGVTIISKDHIGFRCTNPGKLFIMYKLWESGLEPDEIADHLFANGFTSDSATARAETALAIDFFTTQI